VIALVIICAAVVLIAAGLTARRYANQVISEVLAVEQRQIARDQKQHAYEANLAARWQG